MSLPTGFVDELRGRVSLVQLVGRRLTWDRKSNAARGDYWAPCPFHQEKTASFHVDEAKGYYYCFGCHAKGDAVTFLRETENLGFMEAVERLAAEAGIEMPAADPAAAARTAVETGLTEAMEAAVRFYRSMLNGAGAAEARAYLDRRGMSAAARERFEIGFAPDSRTALIEALTARGFPVERLTEAGLVGLPEPGRSGGAYDRFRGRIMFPIRDARGRAIAFGARAVTAGQQPKYLNSPETPLFDKGRSLYNLGPARAAAAKPGTLLVAEGYMDVIALVQAGFEHAVAPLGTAITAAQLQALWRLAPEPVVALDGDPAGQAAAQRLVDLALPLLDAGRSLRFALLPQGQDPDELLRAGGPPAMQAVVDASRPLVDLIWARETEGAVLDSPERRAALDVRLRAHLDRIADPGLRGHYQAEIRARRAALFAPPPRPDRRQRPAPPVAGGPAPATRASQLARRAGGPEIEARIRESAILTGCLNHPDAALGVEQRLERLAFVCADLAEIRDALLSTFAESLHQPESPDSLRTTLQARLGYDPLQRLMAVGQVHANPHFGRLADVQLAARAIDEELTRHAALIGRIDETREAMIEIAGRPDEALTVRLRDATEAAHAAVVAPLARDGDESQAEHAEFVAFMAEIDAQQATRRPRKH